MQISFVLISFCLIGATIKSSIIFKTNELAPDLPASPSMLSADYHAYAKEEGRQMSNVTAAHLSRGNNARGVTASVIETLVFKTHGRNEQILILPFLMHREGFVIHLLQ
jgi:hypothetical protein